MPRETITESSERQTTRTDSEIGWLTIPNALAATRLVGSLGLVALAMAERPVALLALFLALTATDWIDGKLAIWLRQRTTFGARLDSAADAAMYVAVLFAAFWMRGDVLQAEWLWIAAPLATYAVSCMASLLKFRRLPSYHTWLAKSAWLFMVPAVIAFFLDWSPWPLRVATIVVAVANLEALIITIVLPAWRVDVISLRRVLRYRPAKSGPQAE